MSRESTRRVEEGASRPSGPPRRPRSWRRLLASRPNLPSALLTSMVVIGLARWEEGTRAVLDVPLIALVGYSSLTALSLLGWCWARRRGHSGGRTR